MMNSVGLQNIGVRASSARNCPPYVRFTPIFANVLATRWKITWKYCAFQDSSEGVAGYELNVSCPNTKHGGMVFACEPAP
jgi:dihydroorotate dehydrogenase (NAD+) catalytic subunit